MPDQGVLVIGGGIGGLATAFRLAEADVPVCLLEAAPRVGGVIETVEGDGWLFEFGPNTITTAEPSLLALIHDAGLDDEILTADGIGARRYIVRDGRPVPVPMSPMSLLGSPLLTLRGKLRAAAEPFVPRRRAAPGDEESVANFVRRRLGPEVLEYAVGPFISGIYAGDPERLGVRHVLPRLEALESTSGSLTAGAFAARSGGNAALPRRKTQMISFCGGLRSLTNRLAGRLGGRVTTGATVTRLESTTDGWRAHFSGPDGTARHHDAARVVLAVDARTTARLLNAPDLADLPHAGVRVAAIGFRREAVGHPLDGFGILSPRAEAYRLLGVLFTSSIFAGRAPEGHVALTLIAGGATDPAVLELSEDDFLAQILDELRRLLDVRGRPVYAMTRAWPRALPQYELGHQRYLDRALELERNLPGIHLLGSWRGGVSVPDRIRAAHELAGRLARP
ncbi:MAG: protoporphyrinogen oxidase [Candidatus Eisenbacteria bacterium]|nr:protoporphyrinogen oxidase [Candidatus Eisenbacteria bacterium]